jgi:hypothetical protein
MVTPWHAPGCALIKGVIPFAPSSIGGRAAKCPVPSQEEYSRVRQKHASWCLELWPRRSLEIVVKREWPLPRG